MDLKETYEAMLWTTSIVRRRWNEADLHRDFKTVTGPLYGRDGTRKFAVAVFTGFPNSDLAG